MKLFVGQVLNLRKCLFDVFDNGMEQLSPLPAAFASSDDTLFQVAGDTGTCLKPGVVAVNATITQPDGAIQTLPDTITVTIVDQLLPAPKKVNTKLVDILGD